MTPPSHDYPPDTSGEEEGAEVREAVPAGGYDPLQVSLPYFDGPLDLLLHLVRKQELDINELRLAELTEPYLAYVERMQALNLDRASDFLAIAATLVWLKSRSLLPREAAADEDEPDPETVEEMLLLRLQEYQRFKDAAWQLTAREMLGRDVYPRQAPPAAEPEDAGGPAIEEVSLFSLIEAFRGVLERAASYEALHIIPDRAKVEDKIDAVLWLLESRRQLYFEEFFPAGAERDEVILTFIALLELVRLRAVRVRQTETLGPLHCEVTEAFSEGGAAYRRMILESVFGGKRSATEAPESDESEASEGGSAGPPGDARADED